jgi:hypothetical protein
MATVERVLGLAHHVRITGISNQLVNATVPATLPSTVRVDERIITSPPTNLEDGRAFMSGSPGKGYQRCGIVTRNGDRFAEGLVRRATAWADPH